MHAKQQRPNCVPLNSKGFLFFSVFYRQMAEINFSFFFVSLPLAWSNHRYSNAFYKSKMITINFINRWSFFTLSFCISLFTFASERNPGWSLAETHSRRKSDTNFILCALVFGSIVSNFSLSSLSPSLSLSLRLFRIYFACQFDYALSI